MVMIVIKVPILFTIMNLITIIGVIDMYLLFPINSPQAHNGFATWDMMTQTQRRKRKSFSQEFWVWSNGLVSKMWPLTRKRSLRFAVRTVERTVVNGWQTDRETV